jgi:RimJ/RimL family protein N-acetyltransferase
VTIPLFTNRLEIREFDRNDRGRLLQIVSNSQFSFYAFPPPNASGENMGDAIDNFLDNIELKRQPDRVTGIRENYKLAICLKKTRELIGYVALDEISEAHNEMRDIGYFIDPLYWSKGYATEAALTLLEELAPIISNNSVWATVHPENCRSQAVLRKLGFVDTSDRTVNKAGEPRLIFERTAPKLPSIRTPAVPIRGVEA